MTARPDFVIAGAAKCGTTALFEYLSRHPGIFIPRVKDPKFFCSDLKTTGGVYTPDEYRDLFVAAPAGSVTGEVSTLYLYSQVAIEKSDGAQPARQGHRDAAQSAVRCVLAAHGPLGATGWRASRASRRPGGRRRRGSPASRCRPAGPIRSPCSMDRCTATPSRCAGCLSMCRGSSGMSWSTRSFSRPRGATIGSCWSFSGRAG